MALRETAMELADFAQRAAQVYLEAGHAGTFSVESNRRQLRIAGRHRS